MRSDLRDLLMMKEELSEHEIDFTVLLCAELVESHWSRTHRPFEGVDPDTADQETTEALSDQNFKTAYQVGFIRQMGLWRIIALLDGILAQRRPSSARQPLQKKLKRLVAAGLVAADDFVEIREWIELRNMFSHSPVEGHAFYQQLEHGDLTELATTARRILAGVPSEVAAHADQ